MSIMWVLLWLHVEAGMEIESFQLDSFDNHQKCVQAAKHAQVMEIDRTVKVSCVEVEIKETNQ